MLEVTIKNIPKELPSNSDQTTAIINLGISSIRSLLIDLSKQNPSFRFQVEKWEYGYNEFLNETSKLGSSLISFYTSPNRRSVLVSNFYIPGFNKDIGDYKVLKFSIEQNQTPESLYRKFRNLLKSCGVLNDEESDKISILNSRIQELEQANNELKNENRNLRQGSQNGNKEKDSSIGSENNTESQVELPEHILNDYNKLKESNSNVPCLQILNQKLQEIEKLTGKTKYELMRGLQDGGRLIGYEKGQFLFADGGFEPRYQGENGYNVIRNKVHNDGYELHTKETMKIYQNFTGQLFIKSNNGRRWKGSWLESGNNPSMAYFAEFDLVHFSVCVGVRS